MKEKIRNLIKYNKGIYFLYYHSANTLINLLGCFVKQDDNLILFNSFGGRSFNDSPKSIYDHIVEDPECNGYKLVWAFNTPERYEIKKGEKVKTDTLRFFVYALKAKVWITNTSMERGLSFKRKKTILVNTWHGTPLKKIGNDIAKTNEAFSQKKQSVIDLFCSQGEYDRAIFAKCFNLPMEKIVISGLPRNDFLANYTNAYRNKIRAQLGITDEKRTILYCPTFREYERSTDNGCIMTHLPDIKKWEDSLGGSYVLLIRSHYEISKALNIQDTDFVRDVTDYPDINDLFVVADILVSDYSSVFFDYSITGKPMLHYCYDYEEYTEKRGLYFDIRNELNGAESEEEIIKIIAELDFEKEKERSVSFRKKYVEKYGDAASRVTEVLKDMLKKDEDNGSV